MPLRRRELLSRALQVAKFVELTVGLGWLTSCRDAGDSTDTPTSVGADGAFAHGVASGDPLQDRVILWTRVTTEADGPIAVSWELSDSPDFETIVAAGEVQTDASRDYTVKVDAAGLEAGATYYYRFSLGGVVASDVGRTRTLPADEPQRLRLGFVSCQNYPRGFFHVYKHMALRDDIDVVLHLGDYIYEYAEDRFGIGESLGRVYDPPIEIVTLEDYRRRYSCYRMDPDLQEVHRVFPFIVVWDDHESANNSWVDGAENHTEQTEGDWETRKRAAIQAYFEWMPIREPPSQSDSGRIYRAFRVGNLVDLIMLDTRLAGRDEQVSTSDADALADPERTLLGDPQRTWLFERLEASKNDGVAWRVIGQQVLMGQLRNMDGSPRNSDVWDGYAPERARLFDHLQRRAIRDVVVLTGDIHSSWANELTPDPFDPEQYDPETSRGALAVEFVTPAITSPPPVGSDVAIGLEQMAMATHPHIRWVELRHRGYAVLDVTPERVQADWHFIDVIDQPTFEISHARSFAVQRGESRLREVDSPVSPSRIDGE